MKKSILFASLLLLSLPVFADNRIKSTIKEVTVYRVGAKVSSFAIVRVPAGASEVVFEDLSPYFNGNSLQVKIKGEGTTLNAAVFRMQTPGPVAENPRVPVLQDSLILLNDELIRINNETAVLNAENQLIDQNVKRVGITSPAPDPSVVLTLADLKNLATFYSQRILEIKERLLQLIIKQRLIYKIQQRINDELVRLQPNTANSTGEIVLKLDAASAQSLEITCTYIVSQAGWSPLYDLRSDGMDKPLQLKYKANVRNQSGYDWKNITLHLSSALPLSNNNRPILNPVFVDFRPIAVGRDQSEEDDTSLNEVVITNLAQVTIKGSRAKSDNHYIDGVRVSGANAPVADLEELLEPDLNTELLTVFDIVKLQNILADGQENIVTVEEKEIPAMYEYHAVPKLDPSVFLLAKVADYGKYNLLPGIANIFYQDTYVGQTSINPHTTTDTLLLSLGRDEQIVVKRTQPKDFTARKKFVNSSIKETYSYEINIKNNKPIPIYLTILDAIPVSRQKEIEVELEAQDGAKYVETYGKLEWNLEIPAGKSKKVEFTYSVKYPRDKPIGTFAQ